MKFGRMDCEIRGAAILTGQPAIFGLAMLAKTHTRKSHSSPHQAMAARTTDGGVTKGITPTTRVGVIRPEQWSFRFGNTPIQVGVPSLVEPSTVDRQYPVCKGHISLLTIAPARSGRFDTTDQTFPNIKIEPVNWIPKGAPASFKAVKNMSNWRLVPFHGMKMSSKKRLRQTAL